MQTKDEVLAELMAEHVALKKHLETLTGGWVPHDVRYQGVDFVRCWSEKTEIGVGRFIHWLGVTSSKRYDWRQLYGCVNEHNAWVPRYSGWSRGEKEAVIAFHLQNPLEGSLAMLYSGSAKTRSRGCWRNPLCWQEKQIVNGTKGRKSAFRNLRRLNTGEKEKSSRLKK